MGITEEKAHGRFYTPEYIVQQILDLAGYSGEKILRKHAIDNSCGDGAFLAEMIRRYVIAAEKAGYKPGEIAGELGEFIHGIELDSEERRKAAERADRSAAEYGVSGVSWDIRCGNTLSISEFDGKIDYVLGNPPYVRVHHLAEQYGAIKRFRFAQGGMTDLFLVFYEIGIRMLKEGGTLGYIAPSSLFNSKAAAELRSFLAEKNLIRAVVDLKHFQPFDAAAYTAIVILRKGGKQRGKVRYYEYDTNRKKPQLCSRLTSDDFYIDGNFRFGTEDALRKFREIAAFPTGGTGLDVKNGFATLCDPFFIGDWDFKEFLIPVVKASTGKVYQAIFPYDREGRLVPFDRLTASKPIQEHYTANETRLKQRSLQVKEEWYGFGRTQGIKDVYRRKYSVCPIIRNTDDLKIRFCPEGVGVYGGLYILTDRDQKEIEQVLLTDEFMEYAVMLGKYKSGGYYTFSSKELARYLGFHLS